MIYSERIPTLFTSRSCGYHNTAGHRHQATVDGDDADGRHPSEDDADGRHPSEDDADGLHPLTTEPFFKGDAFVRMLRYRYGTYLQYLHGTGQGMSSRYRSFLKCVNCE
jgi:hypothetical protein